jgi:hypothetical protein
LCLKNYYYEKEEEEEYLRPVRDGLIGTWSIGISNTSGSDTVPNLPRSARKKSGLGCCLLFTRVPWGGRDAVVFFFFDRGLVLQAIFLICSFY